MGEATREEALKDFRYVSVDDEAVEAYQITSKTRWQDENWPPWLRKQRGKGEINVVYTDASKADALFIALADGDGQLGYNAFILHNHDGSLSVMGEPEFLSAYHKVVPVPEEVVAPASDGKTDQEFYDSLDEETIEKLGIKNPATKTAPVLQIIDSPRPEEPASDDEVQVLRQQIKLALDVLEVAQSKAASKARLLLEAGLDTAHEGGLKWCNCTPGSCDESSKWGCRVKSPLL